MDQHIEKIAENTTKTNVDNVHYIEAFVEGEGFANVEIINLPNGSRVRDLVVAVVQKKGGVAEEMLVFEEDVDEPLNFELELKKGPASPVHHVHRARKVDVVVHYLNKTKEKAFSPSTRVQKLLDWVVGPGGFSVDPTIAPEMEVALRGETKELPREAHIGRYVQHPHHRFELDLIRGVIPNGAS